MSVLRIINVILIASIILPMFSIGLRTVRASAIYGLPEMSSDVRSFGTSMAIGSTADGSAGYARVAVDSNECVYTTWCDIWTLGLYFAYSHDNGKNWHQTQLFGGGNPVIGCSDSYVFVNQQNGYVYVVWMDNRTGNTNVYLCRSVDSGITFSPSVMVNNVDGSEFEDINRGVSYSIHATVTSDGTVYVAWEDNRTDALHPDIFLAKSTDGGQTFSTNIRVNPYQALADHKSPWVTVDKSGIVYVAYTEVNSTTQNVFLTKSLDGGLSFKAPVRVNDDYGNWYRGKKEIGISQDGKIYIVWTDARNWYTTGWDIYFAASLDGGLSFGTNVRVNDDDARGNQGFPFCKSGQGTPSLAIDLEGGIHIVWEDFRNQWFAPNWRAPEDLRDIYYAFSKDGKQFTKNVRVNYVPNATIADCSDPQIAIDSNDNLKIVWFDSPYDYNNESAYYAVSAPMLSVNTSKTVVGQGYNLPFNVTMLNAGFTNETFDVTVLGNTTMITRINVDVSNGTLATLNLSWNTTGLGLGKYIMSVFVGDVSVTTSIVVTIPGDIDGNFKVQLQDLVFLAHAYGSKAGDPNWNANADINGDGRVSLQDLTLMRSHYGQHGKTLPHARLATFNVYKLGGIWHQRMRIHRLIMDWKKEEYRFVPHRFIFLY